MSAVEALRDGDLGQALVNLQDEVRATPDDPRHRIFLFQLLSVLGHWERALTQLYVVRDLDPGSIAMVRTYEAVLRCEVLRQRVFAGERSPLILGDPGPWVAPLLEALKKSAQGDWKASQQLREQAFDQAPTTEGTLSYVADPQNASVPDEVPFAWLADADSRLGPILEVIVNGCYYWAPMQRIKRIDIEPPTDLRDLVWLPARFLWSNEGEAVGMIPTRYPGSEAGNDPQLQLARRTDWEQPIDGVYLGMGQRVLATDQGEYPIMNIRRIQSTASER